MKRIEFCIPIEAMRGNLSGRQNLAYTADGGEAYAAPDGVKSSALNYQPRLIAARVRRTGLKYFSVRTRSSVNMTAGMRESMAVMGGAGAIYAALLNMKTSQIYTRCVTAWQTSHEKTTFRQYMISRIMPALRDGDSLISIDDVITIDNPWHASGTPNVPISNEIIDKFDSILG